MAQFSPQIFGKYFLVDRIATGGMAEIFKAKTYGHGGFENLVVIKRILPHVGENDDFVEMFVDEAKVSVALQHPNIVRVYDFGQILDDYFIAMECVEGKDARNVLRKLAKLGRLLPLDLAAYLAHQTCLGLHYAHTKCDPQGRPYGIVHRDISPSNLLVGYDGQVKIADFGIAKAESNAYQTRDGVLKGKFEYMSPEQAEGRPLDARSDLFAVGILLWELLTGHRLFKTDSDLATLKKIQAAEIIPPREIRPDIPEALERVVLRALARDPADRFPDAGAMALALREAFAPEAAEAIGARLGPWMMSLFAEEIAQERERLEQNSAVAIRLRAAALQTPGGSPMRLEADWDGQTTSMRPASPRVDAPGGSPRTGPLVAAVILLLFGIGVISLGAVAVVVGSRVEAPIAEAAIDVVVEPDARVYLDGVLHGTGSTLVLSRVEPGEHLLRLEADGHEPVEERVVVGAGEALRYEKVLAPIAPVAPQPAVDAPRPAEPDPGLVALALQSTPPGARVSIDGRALGATPVTWRGRPGQEVGVRLELDGHEPIETRVRLPPSGSLVFERALTPVAAEPGRLAVLLVGGGWAHVEVDGVRLDRTAPLRDLAIAPGPHEIRVVNEALGLDHVEQVRVPAGGSVTVRAAPR